MDTDDDNGASYMSVQSQDTRGLRDLIYPPAVDVSTLSQGIANAINSANQTQQQQAVQLFSNVSDGLLNNIAFFYASKLWW